MGTLYMDSLHFLRKSQSFGESPNLSNMNSDFTSATTDRNLEIPYTIFVVSEQVLDVSVLSEHSTRRD